MNKLKVLDLFSGIGGFSLGLERTGGFSTVAFCEIEPFPRRVLAKHWPGVPIYEDVRELTGARLAADGIAVDVITGGFPCQDISVAGKRAGMGGGTRSGLWSEILRLACDLRPSFIIVENVANLLSGPSNKPGGWFGRILGDLAECGYNAEWENIPAAAMGAPHRRERVWIVAYPAQVNVVHPYIQRSWRDKVRHCSKPPSFRGVGLRSIWNNAEGASYGGEPALRSLDEWLSRSVVQSQLAAYGNTVYPAIPELIGHTILASMRESEAA